MPAARHRPDEDALVEKSFPHADPIAENRTAREWTGGIDRDDGDTRRALAIGAGKTIHERGLAAAGRTGDPDDLGAPGLWIKDPHRLGGPGLVVLYDRDETRDRTLVTAARASK